jgi:hypothetical protein
MRIGLRMIVPMILTLAASAAAQTGAAGGGTGSSGGTLQLKGGVSMDVGTPEEIERAARNARQLASAKRIERVNEFLNNPIVYRVTKVGEINKQNGMQLINALRIDKVKISLDGSVELGQIVEGSGNLVEVPAGTLKKGDLFTYVDTNPVEVPKDHFDPLGALAEAADPIAPNDGISGLKKLSEELSQAADQAGKNALTAADHFGQGLGETLKGTIDALAQPRGGFGRPGPLLQGMIDYLNADALENHQRMLDNAMKAMEEFQKDPARFLGKELPNVVPLGELGKAEEIAKVAGAARRFTQAERNAANFAKFEKGMSEVAQAGEEANAAQNAAQKAAAGGGTPGRQQVSADRGGSPQQAAQQRAQQQQAQASRQDGGRQSAQPPQPARGEQTVEQRQQQQARQQTKQPEQSPPPRNSQQEQARTPSDASAQQRQQDQQRQQARTDPPQQTRQPQQAPPRNGSAEQTRGPADRSVQQRQMEQDRQQAKADPSQQSKSPQQQRASDPQQDQRKLAEQQAQQRQQAERPQQANAGSKDQPQRAGVEQDKARQQQPPPRQNVREQQQQAAGGGADAGRRQGAVATLDPAEQPAVARPQQSENGALRKAEEAKAGQAKAADAAQQQGVAQNQKGGLQGNVAEDVENTRPMEPAEPSRQTADGDSPAPAQGEGAEQQAAADVEHARPTDKPTPPTIAERRQQLIDKNKLTPEQVAEMEKQGLPTAEQSAADARRRLEEKVQGPMDKADNDAAREQALQHTREAAQDIADRAEWQQKMAQQGSSMPPQNTPLSNDPAERLQQKLQGEQDQLHKSIAGDLAERQAGQAMEGRATPPTQEPMLARLNSEPKEFSIAPQAAAEEAGLQRVYDQFGKALAQDATWGGQGGSMADAKPSARDAGPAGSSQIIKTLRQRFGKSPQDAYHGAGSILNQSLGVPVPASALSVEKALKLAGPGSQGIVFGYGLYGERTMVNVRQTADMMEVIDPATGKAASLRDLTGMYFYRTK